MIVVVRMTSPRSDDGTRLDALSLSNQVVDPTTDRLVVSASSSSSSINKKWRQHGLSLSHCKRLFSGLISWSTEHYDEPIIILACCQALQYPSAEPVACSIMQPDNSLTLMHTSNLFRFLRYYVDNIIIRIAEMCLAHTQSFWLLYWAHPIKSIPIKAAAAYFQLKIQLWVNSRWTLDWSYTQCQWVVKLSQCSISIHKSVITNRVYFSAWLL